MPNVLLVIKTVRQLSLLREKKIILIFQSRDSIRIILVNKLQKDMLSKYLLFTLRIIKESPCLKFLIFLGVEIWCQEDLQSSHHIPFPGKIIYMYLKICIHIGIPNCHCLKCSFQCFCKRDFPVSLQWSLGLGLPLHQCYLGVGQLNSVLLTFIEPE